MKDIEGYKVPSNMIKISSNILQSRKNKTLEQCSILMKMNLNHTYKVCIALLTIKLC
jgi:hypothetical protein